MAITFQDALKKALHETGTSTQKIAEATEVQQADLEKILADPSETLDLRDAKKVADFFGAALTDFLQAPELTGPVELADLYNQLPAHLKAQFRAYQPGPTEVSGRSDSESR